MRAHRCDNCGRRHAIEVMQMGGIYCQDCATKPDRKRKLWFTPILDQFMAKLEGKR